VAKRHWKVDPDITPPAVVEAADIRWLNFREKITDPLLLCTRSRSLLLLRYTNKIKLQNYYLAEAVIAQVDENRELAAIWITDIVDDLAGREISSFRKRVRGELASSVYPATR